MAAPPEKTLKDLSGKWTMSKSLTSPIEGTLKIQNFSTWLRKAVSHAPVYLDISHPGENQISIKQSTTAGIPAIDEEWILDWEWREKPDKVMGQTKSRSRWVNVSELESVVKDEFLRNAQWEEKNSREGRIVQAQVAGLDGEWKAEQVWGFENVEGNRRFVRRTVVVDEGGTTDREEVRIVYDWNG